MNPQENYLKYMAKVALIIDLISVVIALLCASHGCHCDTTLTSVSSGFKDSRRSDKGN